MVADLAELLRDGVYMVSLAGDAASTILLVQNYVCRDKHIFRRDKHTHARTHAHTHTPSLKS